MYFADLELCRYHAGPFNADNWSVPLRAVGWLEQPHPFPMGTVSSTVVSKLKEMLEQTYRTYSQHGFRGLHVCSHCPGQSSPLGRSNLNLFVAGINAVYVAPAGIIHYIETHSYLPPEPFLTAVLQCPDCTSEDYREALSTANGGQEIPLKVDHPMSLSSRNGQKADLF
jgi:hypothetical protein